MTFQDIIDFLLSLMRDEDAAAAFEQDPEGTLAAAGLDGVTGQDIREARLQLADSGAVATSSAAASPGGSDPVGEIAFTTRAFSAAPEAGPTFIDQSTTITLDDRDITVDDSDTTIINDSFNSDNDIVAIDNSVDNSVDNVTAIQDNDVVNNDNDVIDIVDVDVLNEAPLAEPAPELEPEPALGPADGPEAEVDEPADALTDAAAV